MAKANKKSLDAKAYINGKVNKFREERRKTSSEEARRQLAENFRETTSTGEYQENLRVVREDSDVIRKYAKRRKWWDIKSEEFKDARTEFYGKNMDLDFWEDFERLDSGKKFDYIFEKFWDTDYAADLIIKLFETLVGDRRQDGRYHIKDIMETIVGKTDDSINFPYIYRWLSEKFWNGIIMARVYFYLGKYVNYGGRINDFFSPISRINITHMTENTLKKVLIFDDSIFKHFSYNFPAQGINNLISGCEDWSISDIWLIQGLRDIIDIRNKNKLSPEWQKYYLNYTLTKYRWRVWLLPSGRHEWWNLWEEINSFEYIIDSMLYNLDNWDLEWYFTQKDLLDKWQSHHKQIANSFIKAWKLDILKKCIGNFSWLTEMEKAEILWDTELESRLNRENFDRDLAKLQELWEKLWIIIEVKEKKDEQEVEEKNEETVENEETSEPEIIQEEVKNEKRRWWRSWFWKKWKK